MRRKFFWSDDMWILSYDCQNIRPWANKKWKNNELVTLNAIHLLYGPLRTKPSSYCDSLDWYLSQKKTISENHFVCQSEIHCPKPQQNQFSLIFVINFTFCLEYSYQSYVFLKETTIKTRGYLGWKEAFGFKVRRNYSCPGS